ncbi:hypothetical protein MKJ01_05415 [Chryseobacterium sp. SSA4.19]|uniref:hypothetical protein n=1 Tax=Chryseobacterium sp. SSA4.19 TaxID=2919915 RepID=UPI001F4EF19F|nr:hypothetical protein [Chryseobacterium sp. SSA4.19]MCJ8153199.1 hypothetical protein [Chryseobacterium sp. SSA4.19]
MKPNLKKSDPFKGMGVFEKQFVFDSFLFCMQEATDKETADSILFNAYKLKSTNYQEIEKEYHRKFPSENKIS